MHGTRDAARNWQKKCSETVKESGSTVGKASPWHFYHAMWGVCSLAYAVDVVPAGSEGKPKTSAAHMATKFTVKVAMAGPAHREPSNVLTQSIC